MTSFFFLLILSALCQMTPGQMTEYYHVCMRLNWTEARTYCREHYEDLAIIPNAEENSKTGMLGWIGLKNTFSTSTWTWVDGRVADYFSWQNGEPNNYTSQESCAYTTSGMWEDLPCSNPVHFTCYRNVTLVKENKTWEEALEYCRQNHHALYFPFPYRQISLDTIHPQTASVWMGLRFLDGSWFWLNGYSVNMVSLPSYPGAQYRCGAQNINTSVWENRGCGEKLNFLCY